MGFKYVLKKYIYNKEETLTKYVNFLEKIRKSNDFVSFLGCWKVREMFTGNAFGGEGI